MSLNGISEKNFINGDESVNKNKNYRVRESKWFCEPCAVFCNSQSQFDVHLISQKHKFVVNKSDELPLIKEEDKIKCEQSIKPDDKGSTYKARISFSLAEIAQNPLAIKFQIDPVRYLITEEKKVGKFEKFGFYCKTCDAYMTGQIQLIMHVRGAKHQFYHAGEIPGYINSSNKRYNPQHKRRNHRRTRCNSKTNIHEFDLNNNKLCKNNYPNLNNIPNGNNNNNHNQNRVPKPFGNIHSSIGHQSVYEHFDNSINNTTIFSMQHMTPMKPSNDSLKDHNYIETRVGQYPQHDFKSNFSLIQSPMHSSSYNISKLNQNANISFAQNGYIQSPPTRYPSDIFGTNNDRMYAYNMNMITNGLNHTQLKDDKSNESEDVYVGTPYTPPPEPTQYSTTNLQYVQKVEYQQQQQQPQVQPTPPQHTRPIIFQNRMAPHAIPLMLPNFPASPIATSSFSFYTQPPHQPQQIQTQQVHQTF